MGFIDSPIPSPCAGAGPLARQAGDGSTPRDPGGAGGQARRHGGGAQEPGLAAGGAGEAVCTGESAAGTPAGRRGEVQV